VSPGRTKTHRQAIDPPIEGISPLAHEPGAALAPPPAPEEAMDNPASKEVIAAASVNGASE
jgi:hypothetical protein